MNMKSEEDSTNGIRHFGAQHQCVNQRRTISALAEPSKTTLSLAVVEEPLKIA